ncbi:MAG: hypothetical protein U0Y96_09920 [Candidatus Kapaibacterium sp.]|nr:hypothetical protein [Bacteroidota bacterium]
MENDIEYYGIVLVGSIKELGRASQIAERFNENKLPIEKFSVNQYPSLNAGFD